MKEILDFPELRCLAKAATPGKGVMDEVATLPTWQHMDGTSTCTCHPASMAVDVVDQGHLVQQSEDLGGTGVTHS